MKNKSLLILHFFLLGAFFYASQPVFAEGSATLYPSGATGKRASLNSRTRTVPRLFDMFPTPGTMKVYVKTGETLYVGSSAQGISQTYGSPSVTYTGTINLRTPNGTTYTSGTSSTTTGRIVNRTEELAGPDRTGVTAGYTPYTRVVTSAEEGIWEVDFVPPTNPDTTSVPQYDVNANADWIQQKRAMIVAWDVSVGSASNPATLIPGRVFMNNFNGNLSDSKTAWDTNRKLDVTLYVLTDAGFKYRVKTNGFNGKSFNFFVNNKGVQNSSSGTANSSATTPLTWINGTPRYQSIEFSNANSQTYMYDPRQPDNLTSGTADITHKIFYNPPAADLPASAPIRYNGGAATTTWLVPSTIPTTPTITNLSVVGAEGGSPGLVGPDGAYIQFTSNVPGTYSITLTFSTGTARTLTGSCVAGLNQIYWDGKNGSGTTVNGGVTVTAANEVKSGEIHFPFEDVEINPNGIIIEQLQPDNSPFSPTRDLVYWDDTGLSGGTAPSPLTNTTGVSSNTNGHKWGAFSIGDIELDYGNNKLLDTWAYVKGNASSSGTTISIKNLDLAVNSVTPNTTSVVVGNTITYTIVVANPSSTGYTDNAVGAAFGFTAPTGFNITSVTYGSGSGTFTENSRSAVSGNTFTSNFNLTSNGTITYTITGTIGTGMAHTTTAPTAYVIRPSDYTDKDATSAIVGAPTDYLLECNGGTSGTGCNNYKTSAPTTVNNSTPVATNDAGSVSEDATLTVTTPGVRSNDTDPDGDALTVTAIRTGQTEGSGTTGTVGNTLTGTYGQITINSDGSYTYVANNAASLNAGVQVHDYFNYTISDGNGGTDIAVIDITITGTNDAPTAVNDAGAVNEDATLNVATAGVLSNDTDPDTGATKSVTAIRTGNTEGSGTAGTLGNALTGTYGQITINANGSYTYVANNSNSIPAGTTVHEYFNYTMSDGNGGTDIAVIDITITGTNDAPTAVNDAGAVNEDATLNVAAAGVLTNDTDPDTGTTKTVTAIRTGQTEGSGTTGSLGNALTGTYGQITINANGSYTYVANNSNSIPAGTTVHEYFNYTMSDGNGGTDIAVIDITITGTNDAPTAVNDAGAVNEDATLTVAAAGVLSNDTDPDTGTTKTVTAIRTGQTEGSGTTGSLGNALTGTYGQITINANGSYTYVANNSNSIPAGTTVHEYFNYTMSDGNGGTDIAVIDITITGTNDAPTAVNDAGAVNEDATLTVAAAGVLSNDTDPDTGTTKTVTAIRTGQTEGSGTAGTLGNALTGTYGQITINGDGSYTYVANNSNSIPAGTTVHEYFNYTMSDGNGGTDIAVIDITITGTNDAPVVAAITKSGMEDTDIPFTVADFTGKFTDADGNALSKIKVVDLPANGTLKLNGVAITAGQEIAAAYLASITFTPNTNWNGITSFNWNGSDGTNYAVSNAPVNITVTPVNDPPVAINDINTTFINTSVSGQVLTNDSDPEGGTLTVNTTPVSGPAHGTVVLNVNGTYTYTPAAGFTGEDTFTYEVCDNSSECTTATVTINVMKQPVTETALLVAVNDNYQGVGTANITGQLLTNDLDSKGNNLTVTAPMADTDGDGVTNNALTLGTGSAVYGTNKLGQRVIAGTLKVNINGTFIFEPNSGFTGTVPAAYSASNGTATDQANVLITVLQNTNENTTFATDDAFIGTMNHDITGNLKLNDYDPQGNTQTNPTVVSGSGPSHGSVIINSDGTFTYTPNTGYSGTDQFIYEVCDDGSPVACDQATVYLNVVTYINLWKGSTNTTNGTDWNLNTNWVANRVPGKLEDVEFATAANNSGSPAVNDLVVPVSDPKTIGNLTNLSGMNLIIPAGASLTVAGVVTGSETNPAKIQVLAAANLPNGTLILAGQPCESTVMGTVELYAKGFKDAQTTWTDNVPGSPTFETEFSGSYHWQHFGVPVETIKANPAFAGSYLRKYHEDWNKTVDPTKTSTYYAKWEDLVNGSNLIAFEGYGITQDVATTYTLAGKMNYCDKTITLTRKAPLVPGSTDTNINNSHYGLGQNIFGNSYTASIDITKLNFPDKVEPTVYLYNTGRFTDWANTTNGGLNNGSLSAGQYTSIPQNASQAIYDGRIPSLNGFLLFHRGPKDINNNYYTSESDVSVTMQLPYANNLLPNTKPQTAPRKPLSYLQVNLASKSTRDNLWLFSQEGTTNRRDDGWDGRKFFGTPTAFIYTEDAEGPMQVRTDKTIDGTVISFYANADTEYTLSLAKTNLDEYADLHLIDLVARTVTPLDKDTTTYRFTATTKGTTIKRFIIANSAYIDFNSESFKLLHGYVKNNDRLIVTNFTSAEGIMNLFDVSGKRFINRKMPVSVSEVPVTLEPGVYILDLQADGKRETIKLIIK